MTVDGQTFRMKPGDTLFLPEHAEHSYANPGRRNAVLVGAVLPPDRTPP
jgi:quercetin dioxygenase-like cupin family protein